MQKSKGQPIFLSFQRAPLVDSIRLDHESYSTESSIGINFRKETERKLLTSPYYKWHFVESISIPSDPRSHSVGATNCAIVGDIGYDPSCKAVVVGALSREAKGGELKLFQLCLNHCKPDEHSLSVGFSLNLLTRHKLNAIEWDVAPNLQLWREDSTIPSAPALVPALDSLICLRSSLYASVISYPVKMSQPSAAGTSDLGPSSLQTCCVVTTVHMPFMSLHNRSSGGNGDGDKDGLDHGLSVESSITVVASTLPKPTSVSACATISHPLNTSSSINTALFNAKFGRYSDTSKSESTDQEARLMDEGSWICPDFRFHLIASPMLTAGIF